MKPLDSAFWAVRPRFPLGAAWSGECRATADPLSPEPEKLREICNFGYGRGLCNRFPSNAQADAVRFQIREEPDILHVQYILERDCWPAGHGWLQYSRSAGAFLEVQADPMIRRQAEVFVEYWEGPLLAE